MKEKHNTNPAGNKGKPFTLAPHSFEDALKRILAAPPEAKPEKHAKKKQPSPKR